MTEPSINSLDKQIAVIEQKLDDGFKNNTAEHSAILELIKDIEERKAGKWVEKAIVGVIVFVCTAVGAALLTTVLR